MSEAALRKPAPAEKASELIFEGPGQPWAIVDAAHTPEVLRTLRALAIPHNLLYEGVVDPHIADVGPYLVRLSANPAGAQKLIQTAWGRNWAVFLRTDASRDELRRHLRKFLTVVTERRRKLLFRFYDPRVLGPYLPTCTPRELETFFGPVERFVFEGEERSEAVICRRDGQSLERSAIAL